MNKQALRQTITILLRKQSQEQLLKKSFKIKKKLFALPEFQAGRVVMFYVAFDGEVETTGMICDALTMGKQVAVPLIDRQQNTMNAALLRTYNDCLAPGPFGILQPEPETASRLSARDIDVVIVPGLAFDRANNRLGRGKGFYDRFFSELRDAAVPRIGLAFSFQMVKQIPVCAHDVALTHVLAS